MKILHVYAGPYPTVQGTQTLVGHTCRLLSGEGHDVHLLTYAHSNKTQKDESFIIHRIEDFPKYHSERSGPSLKKIALDLSLAFTIKRLINKLAPDIIHAHHYEALAAARIADPFSKTPLVFHLHALFEPELPTYVPTIACNLASAVGHTVDRFMPRLANGVGVVSQSIKKRVISLGIPQDRVFYIHPSLEPFPIPDEKPNPFFKAVYVGNLDAYQGLDGLLNGLELLSHNSRKDLRVEIITDSDASFFSDLLIKRKLDDLVKIKRHGTPINAWNLMATADLVLIPRVLDGGTPIKLINALMLGRPTLIDKRLAGELIHEKEAWLINMNRPIEICEALELLMNNSKLINNLKNGSTGAAKRLYSTSSTIADLNKLYKKTTTGPEDDRE